MIRRVLASIAVARDGRRHFSIIRQSLVLVVTAFLIGCMDNPLIDEVPDDNAGEDAIGRIVMRQTGGFAGVSRMITIGGEGGSIVLVSVDQGVSMSGKSLVMPEDLDRLWQTLEANDIFTLSTNQKLLETVRDGFFFEVTVHRGERYNRFSVYAPGLLVESGELRYNAVTEAIQSFAESQLQGTSAITGTVTDLDGNPVAGVRVAIVSGTTDFPEIAVVTNEEGYYQIDGVPRGRFEVAVHDGQGNRIGIKSVAVGVGEPSTLNFVVPIADSEEFIIADMPINHISVQILESFPLQVHILVNGVLRDGCTTLNEITQQREGNTIRVDITTKRPKDAICIQIIKEVTERIPLEGEFLPGRYKVIVNDLEKEFEI